jgi:hypothetical protein
VADDEIPGQIDVDEVLEGEIILAESEGVDEDGNRTIRIYDRARGDFTLEIPKRSTITFGYFNPAAPKFAQSDGYSRGRASDVAGATALRIYERGAKSSQLACFLGVEGFRDLTLKLTRLRQRVVIESNFENDGDGNEHFKRDQMRQLNAVVEDEDIPF